ncbi:PAS domain-containing protein [Methylobacterium sp. WL6]|uniref:PAS domain-containing protein n=1 Tax=Methylobacterium sp. WL6 TaxID=2603901 RepID=UPI0011CB4FA3|nr:PAS domain-containing protein [Methylobacterium sp. WL6]TXN61656.1 PAS domain-containing protein [Methylobacterium sp. WL6]
MIFVTNAEGEVTYVSPEWCAFTGRDEASGAGHGWLNSVHPEDREIAISFLSSVHAEQMEYTFRHRLRRADGSYAWVVGGAIPSFGPPGRTFLGYLGSLTEIASSGSEPFTAYGTLARFVPPPGHPATNPRSVLELVADHLLMAHGLIEQDHAREMLPVLRQALMTAGRLLARNISGADQSGRFH